MSRIDSMAAPAMTCSIRKTTTATTPINVYASVGNDRIVYTDSTSGYQSLWYSRPWREARTALDETGITVTLNGATNTATVSKGSAGTDTIVDISNPMDAGGQGIHGTKGDDVFNLTLDREQWMQVQGGAGDDTFNLRSHRWESESLQSSTIRINYRNSAAGINIDLGAGRASDDGFGDEDRFTFNDGEFQLLGSNFSDTIRGSDRNDSFIGRGGDDVIDGRGRCRRTAPRSVRSRCRRRRPSRRHGYGDVGRCRFLGQDCEHRTRARLRDTTETGSIATTATTDSRSKALTIYSTVAGFTTISRVATAIDILVGGPGKNTYHGGDGEDTLVIGIRDGDYGRIDDFTNGEDRIDLNAWGISSHADVIAIVSIHEDGNGVWIDLNPDSPGAESTGYSSTVTSTPRVSMLRTSYSETIDGRNTPRPQKHVSLGGRTNWPWPDFPRYLKGVANSANFGSPRSLSESTASSSEMGHWIPSIGSFHRSPLSCSGA